MYTAVWPSTDTAIAVAAYVVGSTGVPVGSSTRRIWTASSLSRQALGSGGGPQQYVPGPRTTPEGPRPPPRACTAVALSSKHPSSAPIALGHDSSKLLESRYLGRVGTRDADGHVQWVVVVWG